MEQTFNRKEIIGTLTKSLHGNRAAYLPLVQQAIAADAEFMAHLTAWNHRCGQVRDAKVALPVAALTVRRQEAAFIENACALLADLPTFMFLQATELAKDHGAPTRLLRRLTERYLRDLEANRGVWDTVAVKDRDTMRRLYGFWHLAPGGKKDSYEDRALMRHAAPVGKFAVLRTLAEGPATLVAERVRKLRLPYLVTRAALGDRAMEQDVALALVQSLSPNDAVSYVKSLTRLGIKTDPILRAAYEEVLAKLGTTKPTRGGATLKTTRAAEALAQAGETALSTKLHAAQERQLRQLGGIEGDWLVLGDRSGSMSREIELTRQISAILAKMVTGRVHVVFFDDAPRYFEVTGQAYEQIKALTARVVTGGSTSIGCGLQYLTEAGLQVDGIAIVSDGGQNAAPSFSAAYAKYVKAFDSEPTTYFYNTSAPGRTMLNIECRSAGLQLEEFPVDMSTDFYSLPNLVATMRVSRYSLVDEVYATPLVTLDAVLDRTKGQEVVRGHAVTV